MVDWLDATKDRWVGYPNGLVPVTAESRMAGAYKTKVKDPDLRWYFRKFAIKAEHVWLLSGGLDTIDRTWPLQQARNTSW